MTQMPSRAARQRRAARKARVASGSVSGPANRGSSGSTTMASCARPPLLPVRSANLTVTWPRAAASSAAATSGEVARRSARAAASSPKCRRASPRIVGAPMALARAGRGSPTPRSTRHQRHRAIPGNRKGRASRGKSPARIRELLPTPLGPLTSRSPRPRSALASRRLISSRVSVSRPTKTGWSVNSKGRSTRKGLPRQSWRCEVWRRSALMRRLRSFRSCVSTRSRKEWSLLNCRKARRKLPSALKKWLRKKLSRRLRSARASRAASALLTSTRQGAVLR